MGQQEQRDSMANGAAFATGVIKVILIYKAIGCLLVLAVPALFFAGCIGLGTIGLLLDPPKVNPPPAPVPKPTAIKRIPKPKPAPVASEDPPTTTEKPDAPMPVSADPELINPEPPALPEFVYAKTRKAGEPVYVRAVIPSSSSTPGELKSLSVRLRDETAAGASPWVCDWFKTSGPLAWSGVFNVSNSARPNWIGRVTITGDDVKWSAPSK